MNAVVVKLISGLGNQLFQYALGRQLSLIHNTDLLLDINFFANQNLRSYKLSHYNIEAKKISQKELAFFLDRYSSSTFIAKVYRRLEAHMPKRYHRYFRESEWWVYEPELLHARAPVYLDGYWQHYRYFEGIYSQIFNELTLKTPYPIEAHHTLNTIESDASSVAIHIRRGDYITDINAQKLMGALSIDYYRRAIAYIKTKVKAPVFYIFSDDLQWAFEHLKCDASMTLVDIANGHLDYVELDLMSKCRHVIIANSSFSWWGAFLNRNPEKIVVAPAQWVIPSEINQRIKLQLPTWKII